MKRYGAWWMRGVIVEGRLWKGGLIESAKAGGFLSWE